MLYTAQQAWEAGSLKRTALLSRCEKYAAFTQPIICPPQGYNEQSEELQTDFQSLGNQLVNNLSNKLMLALFAPSRPFFRLDVPSQLLQQLMTRLDVPVESLQGQLAVAERNCIKQLDKMGIRPKLYLALKHLIITGNCLIVLGKKKDAPMRVLGLKRFVVKRSMTGRIIEIVIHEKVRFDELEHDVQAHLKSVKPQQYGRMNPLDPTTCTEVSYFKWIRWDGEKERYTETTQIGDLDLGPQFQGTYSEKDLPYRVLTWELADENDYGTGLVEQNSGDFAALSVLSESEVKGAILASEFRWLVNPAGQTNAKDLENSENGAALPGVKDDIIPLITGTGANMQFVDTVATKYVNRLGRTFLLGASVIRDAERVTAEEVRLVANELETALGGVYSRLAIDFQLPMAYWLVELTGVKLGETEIEPTIVTGLDALSRNGDLDNLKACIMDLAALSGLPPQAQFVLKMDAIAQAIFAGRGVDSTQYIKSPDEQKAQLENQQAAALAQQVARPVSSAFLNANSPQG
ncbi:phage tail protein [Pandoraea faecigallinarum]|uniref:Phage tail protein n=1 Tax=Pandoraea faecigallinarum TaxID=656179 RepID=A0A0H3WN82_9BURK|nr:portal protein [Pandoraea faecigallinarum]AKM29409.1 phage tail protein [Pandoraea faecigallinarum]